MEVGGPAPGKPDNKYRFFYDDFAVSREKDLIQKQTDPGGDFKKPIPERKRQDKHQPLEGKPGAGRMITEDGLNIHADHEFKIKDHISFLSHDFENHGIKFRMSNLRETRMRLWGTITKIRIRIDFFLLLKQKTPIVLRGIRCF